MPEQGPAVADRPAAANRSAARSILEQAVEKRAFPGAAWGVLHNGTASFDAVGRFTYDPSSPAVLPGTVYDLASVSKVVAATAAAMLLVDRNRLNLDARLGDILPGFVIGMEPGSGKERVTLRMLLAHNSGMLGYAPLFRNCAAPDALLRAVLRLPLEAKPGERTEYSDFGFILLGKVIEVLSGEPLDVFCSREIFSPLGMTATGFRPAQAQRSSIPPTENDRTFRGRILQGEVQDEHAFVLGGVAGHAGVFSNAEDLLRFARCLLDHGRAANGQELFQPATVEQFAARQPSGRALGWDVRTQPSSSGQFFGPRSIGHLGFSGCSLWIDPDRNLAVALLTNRTWPDRSTEAIREVRPAFHDAVVEALPAL